MNIRRFVAATSRLALKDVREALGGDAVILANRQIDGGVEILAAASGDLSRLTEPAQPQTLRDRIAPSSLANPQKAAAKTKPARNAPAQAAAVSGEPDWLTEAQIVRTRKRIASLLDDADDEKTEDQLLAEILSGQNQDARTTLSGAARAPRDALQHRLEPALQPGVAAPAPAVLAEVAQATFQGQAAPAAVLAVPPAAAVAAPVFAAAQSAAAVHAPIQLVTPSIASIPVAANGEIADEMRSMRGFIEDQLATLAWRDGISREPARMRLLSDLISAGLSAALSRSVIDHLPIGMTYEQAREWVTQVMQKNLSCATPADDLTDAGGVFALVGPTGVGKTTTAAKIAAKFAVKHGVNQLALITTDAYRIGAQDQLRIYGKILGIPVQTIHDQASLQASLSSLVQKKLVLIDTAGLSQRDDRVAEQIAMLRGVRAQRLLILNATVQTETLEETVRRYASNDCSGCVITKIDEAVRLGGVLDVAVRNRLKLHYVSNGQRVPEDIHHPNPAYLVHRALRASAPNRTFDITPAEQPAWLASVAQSARAVRSAAHV
jgi:flagellar biosynthesis protein FlhF